MGNSKGKEGKDFNLWVFVIMVFISMFIASIVVINNVVEEKDIIALENEVLEGLCRSKDVYEELRSERISVQERIIKKQTEGLRLQERIIEKQTAIISIYEQNCQIRVEVE